MRIKIFLVFICVTHVLFATHERGGYINYYHVSGNMYKLRLYTWTNASAVPADRCDAQLCIDGIDSILCKRINGTGPCASGGPGTDGVILVPPISGFGGIKENIYESLIAYALNPGMHTITYIDPNRAGGIINIGGSGSQNIPFAVADTIYVYNTPGLDNNNPLITYRPVDNVCAGLAYSYDPGMVDPENDSLSFSLIRSFADDPNNVPCGVQQIASQTIPANLSIDPQTGVLSWGPVSNVQGDYDISILIKEYRKSVSNCQPLLLSQTVLDIPLHVVPCANYTINISPPVQSTCILAGTTYTAQLSANMSGTVTSPVTLSAAGPPLSASGIGPNAVFSASSFSMSAAGTFSWQPDYLAIKEYPYLLYFRASDSSYLQNAKYQVWFMHVVSPSPANVTTINNGSNVVLSWSVPPGYTSNSTNALIAYDIYRIDSCINYSPSACQVGPPAGSTFVNTVSPSSNSYTDTGLVNGPHQYFVLARYNDCSGSLGGSDACIVTSVSPRAQKTVFEVMPSPGNGLFNIRFEKPLGHDSKIRVQDILGNTIIAQRMLPAGLSKTGLDLVGVEPGIYFVILESSGSDASVKKIVVK